MKELQAKQEEEHQRQVELESWQEQEGEANSEGYLLCRKNLNCTSL